MYLSRAERSTRLADCEVDEPFAHLFPSPRDNEASRRLGAALALYSPTGPGSAVLLRVRLSR
jgi:hypothetical protein